MDTIPCIQTRQSVRAFTGKPVPAAAIAKLVDVAAHVPSWKNAQPARYTATSDPAVLEALAAGCLAAHNAAIVRSARTLVAVSAVRRRSGYERDGSPTTAYGDGYSFFDAGVAAQTFCLAAWEQGLGTCILGIFDIEKASRILQIPEQEALIVLIPIGWPAGETPAVKKKDHGHLLRMLESGRVPE